MTTTTFKPGDTVYSAQGQQLEYVARVLDGHIVRQVFVHEDYEASWGDPELHSRVFAEVPVTKYAADVAETLAKLEAASERLHTVESEVRKLKGERETLLKSFSQHPDLQPLAEWLDGKITHVASFADYGGGIKIKTLAEAVLPTSADDRRNGEVRLLALYGGYTGPKGCSDTYRDNLRWQLSAYRDGSGSQTICILGTSEENVLQRLQAHLNVLLLQKALYGSHTLVGWAESAIGLGLTVPADLAERVAAKKKAAREHAEKQARDELQRAEAAVVAARSKIREQQAVQS